MPPKSGSTSKKQPPAKNGPPAKRGRPRKIVQEDTDDDDDDGDQYVYFAPYQVGGMFVDCSW